MCFTELHIDFHKYLDVDSYLQELFFLDGFELSIVGMIS
jgi:hypothetical protein